MIPLDTPIGCRLVLLDTKRLAIHFGVIDVPKPLGFWWELRITAICRLVAIWRYKSDLWASLSALGREFAPIAKCRQMLPNASNALPPNASKCHRGAHKQLTTGKAHDWQSLGLQSLELWRMRFPNWWKRWMDEVMTSWLIISDDSAFYLFFGLRKSSRITNSLCHCSSYWRLCALRNAMQVQGKWMAKRWSGLAGRAFQKLSSDPINWSLVY